MSMHQDHGVAKDLLKHPGEFPYLLQLAATTYGTPAAPIPKEPDRAFCYNTLHAVSKGCVVIGLVPIALGSNSNLANLEDAVVPDV